MKKILSAWDFDGCLMLSPLPEEGKPIWKEKTGTEWPHKGWWSKKESLDNNVFDIQCNKNVVELLFKAEENGHDNVLLTSRLRYLSDEILILCKKHNIKLKHAYFKHFKFDKPELLHKIAIDGGYDTVYFYDDRDKEINLMSEHLKNDLPYTLVVHQVCSETGTIKQILTNK